MEHKENEDQCVYITKLLFDININIKHEGTIIWCEIMKHRGNKDTSYKIIVKKMFIEIESVNVHSPTFWMNFLIEKNTSEFFVIQRFFRIESAIKESHVILNKFMKEPSRKVIELSSSEKFSDRLSSLEKILNKYL